MLKKLFPKQINNNYLGPSYLRWVFLGVTLLTIIRSLLHMFLPDSGAKSIATIPLDLFTHNGAATVILMMALWGLSQLLMGFIYSIVLWRYRALIPFMYLLLFIEYTMRIVLMYLKPVVIMGTAPGAILDYVASPLFLILFFLSLKNQKHS